MVSLAFPLFAGTARLAYLWGVAIGPAIHTRSRLSTSGKWPLLRLRKESPKSTPGTFDQDNTTKKVRPKIPKGPKIEQKSISIENFNHA